MGYPHVVIEAHDDLGLLRQCNTIVSSTGVPGLLRPGALDARHRIIIDVGFTPVSSDPLIVLGDVNPAAVPPDAYYTPVPGGIGPMQIAILLERIASKLTTLGAQ